MWCDANGSTAKVAGMERAQPVADVATDPLKAVTSSSLIQSNPLKILSIFDVPVADDMCRRLQDALGGNARAQRSGSGFVEIIHPGIDKSFGAEVVRRSLGIKSSKTLAAGDAENDIGLLKWADISITVENAVPALKAVADHEFPSSDDEGMAKAFEWIMTNEGSFAAGGAPG